jgi:hypothetical protein
MSSPFSGGGYIDVARGVAKATKRGEILLLLARLSAGVAQLLLDLLLRLGIEVGYIERIARKHFLAGRLPGLHNIVERRTGIRQFVLEILLLPRFRTMLCAWSSQYPVVGQFPIYQT